MASEKIFRSAVFGGFNRSDVISYIEDLRNEISDLQRKYADKETKINELEDKVGDLTEKCASLMICKRNTMFSAILLKL